MIDIDGPLAAIRDELFDDFDGAVLMHLPRAALGTGVFVPEGAAQDIGPAVAIDVDGGDPFSVIGAELMDEVRILGNAEGAVAALFIELGEGGRRDQCEGQSGECNCG